jgi:hypothetical protein
MVIVDMLEGAEEVLAERGFGGKPPFEHTVRSTGKYMLAQTGQCCLKGKNKLVFP